jgi:hypothetical protein
MKKLDSRFADLSQVQIFDETDSRLQSAINVGLIRANLAETKLGFLPEVVLITLGNRHVELVADPVFDFPQDGALFLERVALVNVQRQP